MDILGFVLGYTGLGFSSVLFPREGRRWIHGCLHGFTFFTCFNPLLKTVNA
jgi:hypothetical protein